MFDKAVDYSLGALKLVRDWFVTSKIIKKLFTALYTDLNILYYNDDYLEILITSLLIIILMKIILILSIKILAWHNKFQKRKALKQKDERRINVSIACQCQYT